MSLSSSDSSAELLSICESRANGETLCNKFPAIKAGNERKFRKIPFRAASASRAAEARAKEKQIENFSGASFNCNLWAPFAMSAIGGMERQQQWSPTNNEIENEMKEKTALIHVDESKNIVGRSGGRRQTIFIIIRTGMAKDFSARSSFHEKWLSEFFHELRCWPA